MRKLLLATAAAVLLSTPTFAADLAPVPAEPVAPVYAFTWSGFYVGAHVGYGTGSTDISIEDEDVELGDWSSDGFFGGVQVGYNFQFNALVLGAEADASFAGIDGDLDFEGLGVGASTDLNWFGTARLRAGVAMDRALLYATGGVAFGDVENSVADVEESDTSVGWTAGVGLEYAFADNWSVKTEYLHVDLGDNDFTVMDTDVSFDNRFDLFRVGVNYRF
jgi:outer membrane immunogenic protein